MNPVTAESLTDERKCLSADCRLDYKAPCVTCGKRVAITTRGLFAHHMRAARAKDKSRG